MSEIAFNMTCLLFSIIDRKENVLFERPVWRQDAFSMAPLRGKNSNL